MNKKTKQFLHQGILLLLILSTLLTGCGRADHSVTTAASADEQTDGSDTTTENALTTDADATAETTVEETENTVGVPDAKPERILCIEQSEDKITFLRSLLM